jgi:uncharacterized BrkB/YihY/UPF0761 family membrane protein
MLSVKRIWSGFRAVTTRAKEVRAPQLVSAIALRALLSFLPLILLGVAIIGLIARQKAGFGDELVAKIELSGPFGDTVRNAVTDSVKSSKSGAGIVAFLISVLALLPAGLGVVAAVSTACDAVWQVPDRGMADRLLGIPWFLGTILIIAGSAAATSLVSVVPIPFLAQVAALVGAATAGTLLCVWTHFLLTNARVPVRTHVPGAVILGLFLAVFQVAGAAIMARLLSSNAKLWGAFAGVFAFIAVLNLIGQAIVYSAVINVLLWERTHGTTSLSARAPALPLDYWAVVSRGGQRPKLAKTRASSRSPGRR